MVQCGALRCSLGGLRPGLPSAWETARAAATCLGCGAGQEAGLGTWFLSSGQRLYQSPQWTRRGPSQSCLTWHPPGRSRCAVPGLWEQRQGGHGARAAGAAGERWLGLWRTRGLGEPWSRSGRTSSKHAPAPWAWTAHRHARQTALQFSLSLTFPTLLKPGGLETLISRVRGGGTSVKQRKKKPSPQSPSSPLEKH